MPETIIRECATPDCANTWEVWDEDDQRKTCGLCEIEGVAQTPTPTAESEGFRNIEGYNSTAVHAVQWKMAYQHLRRGKPSNIHPPEGLNPTLNRDREEQNGPPGNSHPVQERPGRAPGLREKERQCQTPGEAPMVASEQHGNGEQEKTDATDQKESFRKNSGEGGSTRSWDSCWAGRQRAYTRSWALRCPSRPDTACTHGSTSDSRHS